MRMIDWSSDVCSSDLVPLLLIISSGIVATIAFGVSFLDRTPRAYGFQLFAVTLMLVAVAGVDHPETMFDTVVARVTEISLGVLARSDEHTSELQSLMRNSYAVFCCKKKNRR